MLFKTPKSKDWRTTKPITTIWSYLGNRWNEINRKGSRQAWAIKINKYIFLIGIDKN